MIRNAVRGDNNPGKGFVQGSTADAAQIAMCLEGRFSKETVKTQNIDPNQVLNYVSCHDNYTLYDQLVQTMSVERLQSAYTQADAIVFLSEGIPFIQEGEEFMRSKLDPDTGKYSGNSYNVGDFINVMDYGLKLQHQDVFEKTKELIAFRASHPEFRLASRDEITKKLTDLSQEGGKISFRINDLFVIHTLNTSNIELDGTYEILYSNVRSEYGNVSGTFSAGTNESAVLRKVN